VDYVVLDTDVSSRILRDRLTGPLLARLANRTWCVTFVTHGELWKWADMRSWGPRIRRDLETWLASVVVLPYNRRVSRTWGGISAAASRRGRPTPANDTWIAAGCLARGVPLATLNVKDFADFAAHEGLVVPTN
jgi:predicted nucleic acid-binding protein